VVSVRVVVVLSSAGWLLSGAVVVMSDPVVVNLAQTVVVSVSVSASVAANEPVCSSTIVVVVSVPVVVVSVFVVDVSVAVVDEMVAVVEDTVVVVSVPVVAVSVRVVDEMVAVVEDTVVVVVVSVAVLVDVSGGATIALTTPRSTIPLLALTFSPRPESDFLSQHIPWA